VKTPKKSKFARPRPIRDKLEAIRPRFLAFMLDWITWGYIAYGTMYLLNRYWWRYIDFYNKLTLPTWAWPVVIIATLELAILSHAFGRTIGMAAFHLILIDETGKAPSLGNRLRRFLEMNAKLLLQPLVLLKRFPVGRLLHDSKVTGAVVPYDVVKDSLVETKPTPWFRTYRGLFGFGLLALTFWLGIMITTINLRMLIDRWPKAERIWGELFRPNFRYLFQDVNSKGHLFSITYHMIETIFMALFATVIGAIVAFPMSFLGARNIMGFSPIGWAIYTATRFFFNAVRSIESILIALIFAVWVYFGSPFAGAMALFIHTVAALGKLFSEQVEAVDAGPLEAMAATGARRWQVVIYGVIPQIVPSFLAFTLYRWDINIRMATIIALVGGGGIGTLLFYFKNEVGRLPDAWGQVGAIVIVMVGVVWILDYISGRIREKIG